MPKLFDITPNRENFQHIDCWPCVARLGNDDLLLVYAHVPKEAQEKGWVVGMLSSDNGRTWSDEFTLMDTPGMWDLDPNIIAWDDQVIVMVTTVPETHVKQVTTSKIQAIRSRDYGRTWSEPVTVPMPYTYVAGKINRGVKFADGNLAFPFGYDAKIQKGDFVRDDADTWFEAGVMFSTDSGITWSSGRTLGITEGYTGESHCVANGLDEPALAVCGDGSLYMLMRTGLTCLYEARSSDQGRTWSAPRPTVLVSHNAPADLCVFETPKTGKGWLVVYDNSPVERLPLAAAVSLDEGRTWSRPLNITSRKCASHYPSCIQTAAGEVLAVWQQDSETAGRWSRHLQACMIGMDEIKNMIANTEEST